MKYPASFTANLVTSAVLLTGVNLFYVHANLIVPDGRASIVYAVTTGFVLLYLIAFGIMSRTLIGTGKFFPMTLLTIGVATAFVSFFHPIQIAFQADRLLHAFDIVPIMPYTVILGSSLIMVSGILFTSHPRRGMQH